jgi:3-isopropylmalate/(R)-2-methylmalate dehydratase small subunit
MKPFIRETGIAAPLEGRNIDTDQIIPGRFLKQDRSLGYERLLFHDLRFDEQDQERETFVLNQDRFRHTQILVTDVNFGCGSSREGAVYALSDYGIRSVIAPSFGDIFYSNCLKNGIVPVRLDEDICDTIRETLVTGDDTTITVDLELQRVELADGSTHAFSIDSFWRECLMKGVDDLELTLSHMDDVERFEQRYYASYPWTRLESLAR